MDTTPPSGHPLPGSGFGIEWDRMVNLITEHKYRPVAKLIIGPAKLHRIMAAASDEDRAALERLQADGTIIVSHHLPDPEVAYRYEPPAEFQGLGADDERFPAEGYRDRMTDAIRRAAGGPGSGRV